MTQRRLRLGHMTALLVLSEPLVAEQECSHHSKIFGVRHSRECAIMPPVRAKRGSHAGEDALAFEVQSQPNETVKPAHLAKRKQRNKALEITFNPEEHRYQLLCSYSIHFLI